MIQTDDFAAGVRAGLEAAAMRADRLFYEWRHEGNFTAEQHTRTEGKLIAAGLIFSAIRSIDPATVKGDDNGLRARAALEPKP